MNRLVNLTGLLLPDDFDESGVCISINLCVENEQAYAVQDGTKRQHLGSFLRQMVHIHGRFEVFEGKLQLIALAVSPQSVYEEKSAIRNHGVVNEDLFFDVPLEQDRTRHRLDIALDPRIGHAGAYGRGDNTE
jgi:hypothetical protein